MGQRFCLVVFFFFFLLSNPACRSLAAEFFPCILRYSYLAEACSFFHPTLGHDGTWFRPQSCRSNVIITPLLRCASQVRLCKIHNLESPPGLDPEYKPVFPPTRTTLLIPLREVLRMAPKPPSGVRCYHRDAPPSIPCLPPTLSPLPRTLYPPRQFSLSINSRTSK